MGAFGAECQATLGSDGGWVGHDLPGSSWRVSDVGRRARASPLPSSVSLDRRWVPATARGCSEPPGLPAPALPRELCDLERVTSSLFISVSSLVKWKEGCWAASEMEVLLPAGTLGRHHRSGGLLLLGQGDPETSVGLAGGLVCC